MESDRRWVKDIAGFSLIEVLVVLVIISIIISFATLTFDSEREKLAEEANRLSALMQLASEEAIMNSREYRVDFANNRYEFAFGKRVGDKYEWQKFEEGLFRARNLPEDFSFDLTLGNESINLDDDGDQEEQRRAVVLLLSSGEITPFELIIRGTSTNEITLSNRSGKVEVEQGR